MEVTRGLTWAPDRPSAEAVEIGWWDAIRRVLLVDARSFRPAATRPAVWAAVAGGAGLGLLWGLAARIWMRLLSTHPEFTISGTAMILVLATQLGLFTGLAYAARRRGWRRWRLYVPRTLAVLSVVVLGVGQGAPMVLLALLAALAVTQRRWWRPVRALLGLLALAGLVAISSLVAGMKPGLLAPLNVALFLALMYPLVLGLRVGLEPRGSFGRVTAAGVGTRRDASAPGYAPGYALSGRGPIRNTGGA
jgi:hypothetical protein